MKKYIKISFRGKEIEPIYLSLEKWGAIVNESKNLVAYMLDDEQEWQGRVLNKAEIISAEPDKEYSKKRNEPKYKLYKNKETNTILKLLDGQLPDNFDKYEET